MDTPTATLRKDFSIAIVGGGIAGVTLAIALHHRNITVKVYEQASKFGEVGAGLSFAPNAVAAMKLCHEQLYAAFDRVCTRNTWPDKQKVLFDYVKGYDTELNLSPGEQQRIEFTVKTTLGQNAVHRAHFLDEMVKLLPDDIAEFRKHLTSITKAPSGKMVLHFGDGTCAEADAVVGCDGIKSKVRPTMFGHDHPCAFPRYTNTYVYRGLLSMDQATTAIGPEMAQNAFMHLGKDGHLLTFPINHGKTLNIVAFRHDHSDEGWVDNSRLAKTVSRVDALKQFTGWSPNVVKLLERCDEELNTWAIFDLAENPVPSYNMGRVVLMGDAAHATSPHLGAGAGFCIEDAATLAALLSHPSVNSQSQLETVFATYDTSRRQRGDLLVQSSRRVGQIYDWRVEEIGSDMGKIEREIREHNARIYDVDVEGMIKQAVEDLSRRLVSEI